MALRGVAETLACLRGNTRGNPTKWLYVFDLFRCHYDMVVLADRFAWTKEKDQAHATDANNSKKLRASSETVIYASIGV